MSYKFVLLFLLVIIFRVDGSPQLNYFSDNKTNDKSTHLTTHQIITENGYPVETHPVQTADGYILELHRIPHGKTGPRNKNPVPVFLQHGLLGSSATWVMNGPKKSLGYRLADEGYDVWMGNTRGNTYSRKHIKYTSDQEEFWNFSFHEMGIYDLPAVIDYVLNCTNQAQLIYIGHSQGTSAFYIMASTLLEYNTKIKFQISLAPVGALPHATTQPATLLAPYINMYPEIPLYFNTGILTGTDMFSKIIIALFHFEQSHGSYALLDYFMSEMFGEDNEQFDHKLCHKLWQNLPAGTSLKNLMHSLQLISEGSFQNYDYGTIGNLRIYNSETPPKYDLSSITVPIKAYYGQNDAITEPIDVKLLYRQFSKPLGLEPVKYKKFNHLDFIFAKDINRFLYDGLINFINTSTRRQGDNFFPTDD